jgi:hypothetical protein
MISTVSPFPKPFPILICLFCFLCQNGAAISVESLILALLKQEHDFSKTSECILNAEPDTIYGLLQGDGAKMSFAGGAVQMQFAFLNEGIS